MPQPQKVGNVLVWNEEDISAAKNALNGWTHKLQARRIERAKRLAKLYVEQAIPLEAIGAQEGITRERVRQLIASVGVGVKDSGLRRYFDEQKRIRAASALEHKEARCQKVYGCNLATFYRLSGALEFGRRGALVKKFWEHKINAERVRSLWEITLEQYAEIVGPHMEELGRGKKLLRRIDARQDFTPSNVEVITAQEHGKKVNGFAVAHARSIEKHKVLIAERIKTAKQLYNSGLSRAEIARRMEVSAATISNYLARARRAEATG